MKKIHADSIRSHNFVNCQGPEFLPQFYQTMHKFSDFIRPRIVKLQVWLFILRLTQHVTLAVLQCGAPIALVTKHKENRISSKEKGKTQIKIDAENKREQEVQDRSRISLR